MESLSSLNFWNIGVKDNFKIRMEELLFESDSKGNHEMISLFSV